MFTVVLKDGTKFDAVRIMGRQNLPLGMGEMTADLNNGRRRHFYVANVSYIEDDTPTAKEAPTGK